MLREIRDLWGEDKGLGKGEASEKRHTGTRETIVAE
jgi:hypothetical protein